NDELFVTLLDNNSVLVYSRTASGTAAPLRTLSGPATGLSGPVKVAIGGPPATGSSVTGAVHATLQRQSVALGVGSSVVEGMQVVTGLDGELKGGCDDGSQFTVSSDSNVLLADSLCQPTTREVVDLTQGRFTVAAAPLAAQASERAVDFGRNVTVFTPVSEA